MTSLMSFVDESFKKGEFNQDKPYPTNPSKKNCKYCEFNQTEHFSDGVKYYKK